jgi:uncharacterized protein YjiS (DUF1127 family)
MKLHSMNVQERNAVVHCIGTLANLVRLGIGRIGDRLRCQAAEWELSQLDDRMLRDIGLTRSQIHAAACGLLALGGSSAQETAREPEPSSEHTQPPVGDASTTVARRCCRSGHRLAAACGAALAVSATAPAAATDDEFARLPTVADLPAGTVKVSPPIPGMGEHWANPKDLPLGPIYCVMRQRVVCAEFMVSQQDLRSGTSFERLRFGLDEQPPIDHLELTFLPHGHEGFAVPHYDLHMYFVSPEARFSQQSAAQ